MDRRLKKLLDLLDQEDDKRVGTSMRLPVNLRQALAVAREMGLEASTTELAVSGLRGKLEAFANLAVLEGHYKRYPHVRPDLAEVALAMAELEGNPLAERPDLVTRAAAEIGSITTRPTPDEVLLYAAGLAAGLDSAVA